MKRAPGDGLQTARYDTRAITGQSSESVRVWKMNDPSPNWSVLDLFTRMLMVRVTVYCHIIDGHVNFWVNTPAL